ncbi:MULTISPECIES: hypothetical protein [Rhodanobacteraceae]|uniref:hypothetical protein n=1 Tax=Rhodanobacteraceae TaxID=1775411 RepID=UPI000889B895|nr:MULTISPECIES: hypothetical protein [Rhodanobacteraceae]SDF24526.1 hypothetical protein SAMN04515659_0482 [Dyella sp. 333MFSha]SKB51721.1 hypothetical protein SAMN05660880_01436 [Luteibacter sp. 22Crub2.1]
MERRVSEGLRAGGLGLCCLLASCSHTVRHPAPMAHDGDGLRVARAIQARYDDSTNVRCNGSATAPSFLCSGVMLRSTGYPASGHAWDPKGATNPKPGGISFSWMRRDAQFNKVAHGYTQGFVLIPVLLYDGRPFRNMEVLCAYAIDGASDERASRGCGAHRKYLSDSGPCQSQGIVTAAAWLLHYVKVSGEYEQRNHQCGFAVMSATPNSSAIFQEALGAMRVIKQQSFREQNELVVEEWSFGDDARLPIEAFFYISGQDGPRGAMAYQRDFQAVAGRWVPVIRLTLAPSAGDRATFTYRPQDQAIP